jgi:hypothetical protein
MRPMCWPPHRMAVPTVRVYVGWQFLGIPDFWLALSRAPQRQPHSIRRPDGRALRYRAFAGVKGFATGIGRHVKPHSRPLSVLPTIQSERTLTSANDDRQVG